MALQLKVLPDSSTLRGTIHYVQCQHVIPRVRSAEALARFPKLKTCQRCATVHIGDNPTKGKFCVMHAGQFLLKECMISEDAGRFHTLQDVQNSYQLGRQDERRESASRTS